MCQKILILLFFIFQIFVKGFSQACEQCDEYSKNIFFQFYFNNTPIIRDTSFSHQISDINGCRQDKPWVIIIHGYENSCEEAWVRPLVANFTKYRGGCIVCMDYSKYAYGNINFFLTYIDLRSRFMPIANVLKRKLEQFHRQGFQYELGMLFGLSFGGQLALHVGHSINGQLAEIDACDPAGVLFYPANSFNPTELSDRKAAKNVQCIHTSGDYGTLRRDCDQDWEMGDCGLYQQAAEFPGFYDKINLPYLPFNHHICPYLYNSAFENKFPAVNNRCCLSNRRANLSQIMPGYRMGYMQKDKGQVKGKTLFALTFKQYPYNKPT